MKAFPFKKPVPLGASGAHWEEGRWLSISKQCMCLSVSLSHLVTRPFFRAARSTPLHTRKPLLAWAPKFGSGTLSSLRGLTVQYLAPNETKRKVLIIINTLKKDCLSIPAPFCVHKVAPSASCSEQTKLLESLLTLTVLRGGGKKDSKP